MYTTMPNEYLQNNRDAFRDCVNSKELDKLQENTCTGCKWKNTCEEKFCKFYKDYIEFRDIIGDGPRIIYVEKKIDDVVVHETRKYKIKPAMSCKRTVLSQITKYQKHFKDGNESLAFVKELIEKESFKRARIHAKKGGFNKIVEVLDKYIESEGK